MSLLFAKVLLKLKIITSSYIFYRLEDLTYNDVFVSL